MVLSINFIVISKQQSNYWSLKGLITPNKEANLSKNFNTTWMMLSFSDITKIYIETTNCNNSRPWILLAFTTYYYSDDFKYVY